MAAFLSRMMVMTKQLFYINFVLKKAFTNLLDIKIYFGKPSGPNPYRAAIATAREGTSGNLGFQLDSCQILMRLGPETD